MKTTDIKDLRSKIRKELDNKDYIASVFASGKKFDQAELDKRGIKFTTDVLSPKKNR